MDHHISQSQTRTGATEETSQCLEATRGSTDTNDTPERRASRRYCLGHLGGALVTNHGMHTASRCLSGQFVSQFLAPSRPVLALGPCHPGGMEANGPGSCGLDRDRDRVRVRVSDRTACSNSFSIPMAIPMPIPTRTARPADRAPRGSSPYRARPHVAEGEPARDRVPGAPDPAGGITHPR